MCIIVIVFVFVVCLQQSAGSLVSGYGPVPSEFIFNGRKQALMLKSTCYDRPPSFEGTNSAAMINFHKLAAAQQQTSTSTAAAVQQTKVVHVATITY